MACIVGFTLLLVVLDTLRADHLVPYGYARVTTQELDRWVEEHFTIYNETQETKVLSNPEQRSWDDNLQFMVDRIRRFLSRRNGKIRRYLRDNPRLPLASAEPD